MEEVTEPDNACDLSSEVCRQPCCTTGEEPRHRIELSPAIGQIGPSDCEVSRTQSGNCGEQYAVFAVQESVLGWCIGENGIRDGWRLSKGSLKCNERVLLREG
jgi:hypothetical protein